MLLSLKPHLLGGTKSVVEDDFLTFFFIGATLTELSSHPSWGRCDSCALAGGRVVNFLVAIETIDLRIFCLPSCKSIACAVNRDGSMLPNSLLNTSAHSLTIFRRVCESSRGCTQTDMKTAPG
jgi:hypothetical protein